MVLGALFFGCIYFSQKHFQKVFVPKFVTPPSTHECVVSWTSDFGLVGPNYVFPSYDVFPS